MKEYLSNDNKGNPDKKLDSGAHLFLVLLNGKHRSGRRGEDCGYLLGKPFFRFWHPWFADQLQKIPGGVTP